MPCLPDCGSCCIDIRSETPARFQEVLDHEPTDADSPIYKDNYASAVFVKEHWHVDRIIDDKDAIYQCDMLDRETRKCMAHDQRPPVCSKYPWYGKLPKEAGTGNTINHNCGYMSDIRTVLPIVQITTRRD